MTTVQLQLFTDVRSMFFHGADTNVQLVGALFVRFVGRDQLQHLAFGRSEIVQARLLLY